MPNIPADLGSNQTIANLLGGASRRALDVAANGFVLNFLERVFAQAAGEIGRAHSKTEERQRLLENRNERKAGHHAWHEKVQFEGLFIVEDMDPETGERVETPEVYDGNGNLIQGATSYTGRFELRSNEVRLRKQWEDAEKLLADFDARNNLTSPFKAGNASWARKRPECADFLNAQPNARFERYTPRRGFKPDLSNLEKLGREAEDLLAEIDETENASQTIEEDYAAIDAYVDQGSPPCKFVSGNPRARGAGGRRRGPKVTWTPRALTGVESSSPNVVPVVESAEAIALWLAGDRIREELKRQAREAHADGRLALTDAERDKRLAKLRAKLHAIELEEAAHLWGLVDLGHDVTPRKGLSARALLQIL